MRINSLTLALVVATLCTACSTTRVSPIATSTGTLNVSDQSITETRNNIAFTVKLDAMSVSSQPLVDTVAAFHVTIDNQTDAQTYFPLEAFVLKDGEGRQYRSISPEQVRDIVSKDTVYLIPYPYVGYYYLKDQVYVSQTDTFTSSLPFYTEYHPQDIFTRALPDEPILKRSKIAGLVYFIVDIDRTDWVELLLFADALTAGDPLVSFRFAVEK